MYEIKTEEVYENFSKDKDLFDFNNYSDSNKLVAGKMRDETVSVCIEGFVGLISNMYSLLVDDSNEHEKGKGVLISHNEYKDVLLNNKCLRHSMNKIHLFIYLFIYSFIHSFIYLLSTYKMTDSEYSPDNYKSSKIKIDAIIKIQKCYDSFLIT